MNWNRMAVEKLSDLRLCDIVAGRLFKKVARAAWVDDKPFSDWERRRCDEATKAHHNYVDAEPYFDCVDDTMDLEDAVFGDSE